MIPLTALHEKILNISNLISANNRAASKNIFRSIFCCFKTSHGPSHSKRSKSTDPKKSKDKKSSFNNETQFNDLNNGTSALTINNNNNDANGSEYNDSNVDNNSVEENSKNAQNYNSNGFNNNNNNNSNNSNGNSLNNNGQPNYFQNGNDNINLNNIEKPLLEPLKKGSGDKKCLIIDLDETLVHSSFKVSHQITSDLTTDYNQIDIMSFFFSSI